MSDVSQGDGWWEAKDGKWYPPERHPDYKAPAQIAAPVAPTPPPPPSSLEGDGWWKASDGNWYPPERHPSYQPPNPTAAPQQANSAGFRPLPAPPASSVTGTNRPDGWWKASDGNWYPPEQNPNYRPPDRRDEALAAFSDRAKSPRYTEVEKRNPGNGFSNAGLLCGVIALGIFPPLFGIIGIILGAVGASRGESKGAWTIGFCALCIAVGMYIGAVVFTNMM
jgi:hypothetical protein